MTTALDARAERWWSAAGVGLLLPIGLLITWQVLGTAAGTPRTPLPVNILKAAAAMIASGDPRRRSCRASGVCSAVFCSPRCSRYRSDS